MDALQFKVHNKETDETTRIQLGIGFGPIMIDIILRGLIERPKYDLVLITKHQHDNFPIRSEEEQKRMVNIIRELI